MGGFQLDTIGISFLAYCGFVTEGLPSRSVAGGLSPTQLGGSALGMTIRQKQSHGNATATEDNFKKVRPYPRAGAL